MFAQQIVGIRRAQASLHKYEVARIPETGLRGAGGITQPGTESPYHPGRA